MLAIIFILLTPVGMLWPITDQGTLMLIADLHDNTLSCEISPHQPDNFAYCYKTKQILQIALFYGEIRPVTPLSPRS